MSHKITRTDFNKITWYATEDLVVTGARILALIGMKGHRWVSRSWLRPGDRVRITVERVPESKPSCNGRRKQNG